MPTDAAVRDPGDEIHRPTLQLPDGMQPEALIETDVFVAEDTSHVDAADGGGADGESRTFAGTLGEYELLDELGRGGMGVVYRARQTTADRIVALKIIRPDHVSDFDQTMRDEAIRRFQIEARAAARLDHDHLVTVYDVGQIDGYHFYSMRFVPGESLADRIDEAILSGQETARLLGPVAAAIDHAHRQGVLHRDLKPQNILIDRNTGRALVADFGLAKLYDPESGEQQTATRGIVGTVAYMAPEQTQAPMKTSPATDVWALGAIIYCCLTGRPPFRAKDYVATFKQIQEADPASPRLVNPDIERDIETICLKCLEKAPERRYASAGAVAEELGRFLRGEPILARPPGLAEKVLRTARRHKGLVATAAIILVLIGGGVWAAREASARSDARGLFGLLMKSQPGELPAIASSLQPVLPRVRADLRAALASPPTEANRNQRIRAAMALLPTEPRHDAFLAEQILTCEVEFVRPLVDALAGHAGRFREDFWRSVLPGPDARQDASVWFRRASALANWDPHDSRWKSISGDVAQRLVAESSFDVAHVWLDAYRPVRDRLLDAVLREYDLASKGEHRSTAAQVIAAWYADDAEALARFALLAEAEHYRFVAPRLVRAHRASAVRHVEEYLAADEYAVYRPDPTHRLKAGVDVHAKRKANAVAVLCQLKGPDVLWPYLQWQRDPQLRSYLVHRLSPDLLPAQALLRRLAAEDDASIRRAILLVLGECMTEPENAAVTEQVFALFQTDRDAGVHSAAEWCLRQWGLEERIGQFVEAARAEYTGNQNDRNWYINPEGHTMAILPAGRFEMGSPPTEPGRRDWEPAPTRTEIPYSFSLSTTEVTRAQIERVVDHQSDARWSPEPNCPVGHVTWLLAAAYCNHLSEVEGLPESQWCYDPDNPLVVDASRMSRRGYRLPTEAEWEYACRAGATTARHYGSANDLLSEYAWYAQSPEVSRPVGMLKPNDFGLFDMYGNAWEWCGSFVPGDLQEGGAAVATDFTPAGKELFDMAAILRSETVRHEAANMRSAMRTSMGTTPQDHTSATGFRVARTESAAP